MKEARRRISPATLQEVAEDLGVNVLVLERDWVLTEIIYRLGQQLGQDLILKGGQALRHIYGSTRFSKDVDYVARRRIEFEELREHLTMRFPPLRLPDGPAGRTKFGLTVDPITYTGPLRIPGTVEVEVSFREQALPPSLPLQFISPFREPFPVAVLDLHEMVAEKVRALYQRGNPRDLYDLWFIFSHVDIQIDPDTVARVLPVKFGLVRGGFRRPALYTNIENNARAWDEALRAIVVDPPSYEDALIVVQGALRPTIARLKG